MEKLKARLGISAEPGGLAYFYCSYKESDDYGLTHVMLSLLAQLVRCFSSPESGPAMRLFERYDDGTLAAKADDLRGLLIDLIHELEVVFICLDAVDECSSIAKGELLRLIRSLMSQCGNVKIIVSSRSGDSEVYEAFEGCRSITITPHAVASDIDQYIKNRIDQGPKRLRLARPEHVVNKLIVGAQGMYDRNIPLRAFNLLILPGFCGFLVRWISFRVSVRPLASTLRSIPYHGDFLELIFGF